MVNASNINTSSITAAPSGKIQHTCLRVAREHANRPNDEKFWTLEDMLAFKRTVRDNSAVRPANLAQVEYGVASNNDLLMAGRQGRAVRVGHYALNQLARTLGFPATALRKLGTEAAAVALNDLTSQRRKELSSGGAVSTITPSSKSSTKDENDSQLLFDMDTSMGYPTLRAVTSNVYDRVWDSDLIERVAMPLVARGWRTAPGRPTRQDPRARPATEQDVLSNGHINGLSIKVGDTIAPASLYAADHNSFMFFVKDEESYELRSGVPTRIIRGVTLANSEVGDARVEMRGFTMVGVCGNLILWDCKEVFSMSFIHRAGASDVRGHVNKTLRRVMEGGRQVNAGQMTIEAQVKRLDTAAGIVLGKNDEEVVEAAAKFASTKRITSLTRPKFEAALATAKLREARYGNPFTAYAVFSGLTENSQESFTDDRVELDTAAGKWLTAISN